MVFPSLPLYLDPPNWSNQQQQQVHGAGDISQDGGGSNVQQLPPPPRSGSMAERARLAKIPQPDPALRCPRCDSSNTKFCYFNNYSLTQPRHFCKTCRRYWTRGGALRNVPVGGGCRRNRRTKSSTSSTSSKSQIPAAAACSSSTATSDAAQAGNFLPVAPLQFLASSPWQHMQDYSSPSRGIGFAGLTATGLYVGGGSGSSSLELEQWRIQQAQSFPFWGGSEAPYSFQGEGVLLHGPATGSSGLITHSATVKMDGTSQGLAPRSGDDPDQQFIGLAPRSGDDAHQFIGSASRSDDDPQQFWSTTIAAGHDGGSSFFGGGSNGNGTVGGSGGGGGGYMGINDVSGGFKSLSTARLS